jgi:hypothetical protein
MGLDNKCSKLISVPIFRSKKHKQIFSGFFRSSNRIWSDLQFFWNYMWSDNASKAVQRLSLISYKHLCVMRLKDHSSSPVLTLWSSNVERVHGVDSGCAVLPTYWRFWPILTIIQNRTELIPCKNVDEECEVKSTTLKYGELHVLIFQTNQAVIEDI